MTLANADIAGLLATGIVTDTADATDASSSIADAAAELSALASLSADTLNAQHTAGDGTLTVDAISVSLLGSTQTLDLA